MVILPGPQYAPTPQDIHDKEQAGCLFNGIYQETLNAQDIPWVREWLQGEPEEMIVGVSLSLLNGGIFPIDDIPDEFRSILEWEHEIELISGSDWESSFHISAVLNESPTGPLYTLMLIMRDTWLQSGQGSRLLEGGYTTHDHSSDKDYSLSGDT